MFALVEHRAIKLIRFVDFVLCLVKLDLDAGGIVLGVLHHLFHVLSFRAELVDELHEGLDDLGRLVGVVLAVVKPRRVVSDHAVLANCRRT